MPQVFLCHASEDKAIVKPIQLALASAGCDVFYDDQSLPPGGDYQARIRAAICSCDVFVFVASPASLSPGKFTLTELKIASERWPSPIKRVLPVVTGGLKPRDLPSYLQAATALTVDGNVAAEVRYAVEHMLRDLRPVRSWRWIAALAVGVVALATTTIVYRSAGTIFSQPSAHSPPSPQTFLPLNHEAFWEAITRADVATIERLAKDGMRLKPEYLYRYFTRYFTEETFAALQKYKALPSSGCPVDGPSLDFYAVPSSEVQRATSIRQVCGIGPVVSALELGRSKVAERNDAARAAQAEYGVTVEQCRRRELGRYSVTGWYEAASRFSITSLSTYTLEQAILSKLNAALLLGSLAPRDMAEFLSEAILEQCHHYNKPPSINEKLLQSFDLALRNLKAS